MKRGEIYPSWRYHRTEKPVICQSPEHDAELGEEWADTPAAFAADAEPAPEASEPEEAPKKRGRKSKA